MQLKSLAVAFLTAVSPAVSWAASASNPHGETEIPMVRSYFYIGGQYADNGNGEHVWTDQMYVERLVPAHGPIQDTPIILIHGKAQTATNWLNKPDGGRGWASNFISQGYELYIVDQPLRGRSPLVPAFSEAKSAVYTAEYIQQRFTAPQKYMLWPQAALHTQWPGTGVMGDEIFDAFYQGGVQFITNNTHQQLTMQKAGKALLERIGKKSVVVGHSQAGPYPLLIADVKPELVRGLILLEPTGPQFQEADGTPARIWGLTDVPLNYAPTVADPSQDLKKQSFAARAADETPCVLQDPTAEGGPRQLPNLVDLPILVVTSEASYHAPYDYCTVEYLKQAGCHKTLHWELGQMGIKGNGHMFFMEKNGEEIQAKVEDWIATLM